MKEIYVISCSSTIAPPVLLQNKSRLEAMQALEAVQRRAGNVAETKGHPAIRAFIENTAAHVVWGKFRLDAYQQESK